MGTLPGISNDVEPYKLCAGKAGHALPSSEGSGACPCAAGGPPMGPFVHGRRLRRPAPPPVYASAAYCGTAQGDMPPARIIHTHTYVV